MGGIFHTPLYGFSGKNNECEHKNLQTLNLNFGWTLKGPSKERTWRANVNHVISLEFTTIS